jgi:hypothetical protein
MKSLKLFYCLLLYFSVQTAKAQNYYVLPMQGLSNTIQLNKGSSFSILADSNSLGYSNYIKLPFAFTFFNKSYNGFRAYADGRISFDSMPLPLTQNNVSLLDSSSPTQTIFAFWDQTILKNFNTGVSILASDIQTWTDTTQSEWVQTILWRLVRPQQSSTLNAYTYYAVRLYQNNEIDIVHLYGTGSFSASVGLKGLNLNEVIEINGSPLLNFGGANLAYVQDSVRLFKFIKGTQAKNNLAFTQIKVPSYIAKGKTFDLNGQLLNKGFDTLKQFMAKVYANDTVLLASQNFENLGVAPASYLNFSLSLSSTNLAMAYTNFSLVLSHPNLQPDADSYDNSLSKEALVYASTIPKKVLHEVFSSSSTGQGPLAIQALQQTLNANPNSWNMIYYPMNFPNFGDPYYMSFSGVRFLGYDLNLAPALVIDGQSNWSNDIPNAALFNQTFYEPFLNQMALANVQVSLQRNGQSFATITRVEPIMPLKNKQLTLKVALVEKVTYNNTRNNGQNEFYHVVKAILPNVFGEPIDLSLGKPAEINNNYTFNGSYRLPASGDPNLIINPLIEHSVENFENLYAVAFVQDEADKLVWQSASSAPLLPLNKPELTTSEITVFPNPAKDQIQIYLPNGIENAQIRIWNSTGILVQTEPNYESGNILTLTALPEGINYLEIKTTKGAVWKKLASAPLGNR